MRSIYMLSLLETCEETMDDATDLIIVENPKFFFIQSSRMNPGISCIVFPKNAR